MTKLMTKTEATKHVKSTIDKEHSIKSKISWAKWGIQTNLDGKRWRRGFFLASARGFRSVAYTFVAWEDPDSNGHLFRFWQTQEATNIAAKYL